MEETKKQGHDLALLFCTILRLWMISSVIFHRNNDATIVHLSEPARSAEAVHASGQTFHVQSHHEHSDIGESPMPTAHLMRVLLYQIASVLWY